MPTAWPASGHHPHRSQLSPHVRICLVGPLHASTGSTPTPRVPSCRQQGDSPGRTRPLCPPTPSWKQGYGCLGGSWGVTRTGGDRGSATSQLCDWGGAAQPLRPQCLRWSGDRDRTAGGLPLGLLGISAQGAARPRDTDRLASLAAEAAGCSQQVRPPRQALLTPPLLPGHPGVPALPDGPAARGAQGAGGGGRGGAGGSAGLRLE